MVDLILNLFQANGTEVTKDVDSVNTTIAHSVIYRNRASTNSNIPVCEEGICNYALTFKWVGENICKSNVICTKLDDNPCEDFGITLTYPDSK